MTRATNGWMVTLYGLTLLAIRVLGSVLDAYARHEHLYSTPRGRGGQRNDEFLPVVIGYVIAILVGLALPIGGGGVVLRGIAVYLVVPFREASRVLFRRSRTPTAPSSTTRSRDSRPGLDPRWTG